MAAQPLTIQLSIRTSLPSSIPGCAIMDAVCNAVPERYRGGRMCARIQGHSSTKEVHLSPKWVVVNGDVGPLESAQAPDGALTAESVT